MAGEGVHVLTRFPPGRRLRRRFDVYDPEQHRDPLLERGAFLLVIPVPIVDGGHGVVRDAAMIQHVGDVKAVHAGLTHERGSRAPKIVSAKFERETTRQS